MQVTTPHWQSDCKMVRIFLFHIAALKRGESRAGADRAQKDFMVGARDDIGRILAAGCEVSYKYS